MSTGAAIYARKSQEQTGVNEEAKSVARQIERATEFAERRGWSVSKDHIFVDDGISGAEFEGRNGLMRLLGALKPKPPFGVLVVMAKDRLGREQYESAYNLKRLAQAGIRVFEYLEGRECLLDTPMDKFVEMVGCFAAEQERYQASRRTRDALARKAEHGYVTGGAVFGYRNVPVYGDGLDANGQRRRQYVVRKIDDKEATIVQRMFEMRAMGMGFKKIACVLNEEGVMAPRPRRNGRPRSWAPASVRGILTNPLYKADVIWGRKKKRDSWGLKKYLDRPKDDWLVRRDESLRIVSDDRWEEVQAAIAADRKAYQRQDGLSGGRPAAGVESKYLLSGFIECSVCHGGMYAWSRDLKTQRRHLYVCGYHHERGSVVCGNGLPMAMDVADAAVLGAVERDLIREPVLEAAVQEAVQILGSAADDAAGERRKALQAELAEIERQLARYAEAVGKTGPLDSLLAEIDQREKRRAHLKQQLATAHTTNSPAIDVAKLKVNLRARLTDWQGLLKREKAEARQVLRELLVGRLVFEPKEDETGRYYAFTGRGSISPILRGIVVQDAKNPAGVTMLVGMTNPAKTLPRVAGPSNS